MVLYSQSLVATQHARPSYTLHSKMVLSPAQATKKGELAALLFLLKLGTQTPLYTQSVLHFAS
jgi:hypothetical protein